MQIDFNKFKKFLDEQNLSEKTKEVHIFSVKQFYKHFKKNELNKNTILEYRTYLMENFSPKTTNLRLTGVNSYLKSIGQFEKLHVDALKIQQKSFLENVISEADYDFLKEALMGNIITKEEIRKQAYKEAMKLIPLVVADTITFFPKRVVKFFSGFKIC